MVCEGRSQVMYLHARKGSAGGRRKVRFRGLQSRQLFFHRVHFHSTFLCMPFL